MRHVLTSLIESDDTFIVSNRNYPQFNVPVHRDKIRGGDSLSGIHSALSYAKHDVVAVAACDLPNLKPEYWRFLMEYASGYQAVVALGPDNWIEPLAALYHKSLEPLAKLQLQSGDYFLKRFVEIAEARIIPWSEVERRFGSDIFLNANRIDDLTGG